MLPFYIDLPLHDDLIGFCDGGALLHGGESEG